MRRWFISKRNHISFHAFLIIMLLFTSISKFVRRNICTEFTKWVMTSQLKFVSFESVLFSSRYRTMKQQRKYASSTRQASFFLNGGSLTFFKSNQSLNSSLLKRSRQVVRFRTTSTNLALNWPEIITRGSHMHTRYALSLASRLRPYEKNYF